MRHLAGAPVVCSTEPKGVNLMAFLDAGDAGRVGEEWLSGMARAVGIERGRIERFTGHMGEPQADAHTVMLWDGPSPLACYTVVRDDFNRSKLLLWTRGSAGNAGVNTPVQFIACDGCTLPDECREKGCGVENEWPTNGVVRSAGEPK